jgi:hypothetical protein
LSTKLSSRLVATGKQKLLLPRPDHHDRAACVTDALLADRPGQQSGEAASPSCADDQEVGVDRPAEQHAHGVALLDDLGQLGRELAAEDLPQEPGEAETLALENAKEIVVAVQPPGSLVSARQAGIMKN